MCEPGGRDGRFAASRRQIIRQDNVCIARGIRLRPGGMVISRHVGFRVPIEKFLTKEIVLNGGTPTVVVILPQVSSFFLPKLILSFLMPIRG